MIMEKNLKIISFVLLVIITSCDDSGALNQSQPLSTCQKVFERISECVGGRVPYDGRGCNIGKAESLLKLDCESLLEEIR
jgi:hypothetical protein